MATTKDDVIGFLRHAMEMEHMAILQYLLTAWTFENAFGSDVEAIARDEMRHFKYLAHAVVSLGGEPNMTRPRNVFRSTNAVEQIRANAAAEQEAAETYVRYRDAIPDELAPYRQLFDRLIGDEEYHRGEFQAMIEKAEAVEPAVWREPTTPREKILHAFLEEDITGEYGAILRYLHQSFVVKDGFLADSLEDRAIEEMRHMGDLSEEKVEAGGEPALEPGPAKFTRDLREIFQNNLDLEQAAEARYTRHIEGHDDPGLQRLWAHIRFQEEHHSAEFRGRLESMDGSGTAPAQPADGEGTGTGTTEEPPKTPRTTIGSLFRKPQQ